jgi:CRISPR-associated protein Csb1
VPKTLDLKTLTQAVADGGVAFRCRVTLEPAAGEGTKVFPPTYAGGVYATEKRRLKDREKPVECVLLDSVQSQANRMEEALQQAVDDGRLKLPMVEVDFAPYYPGEKQGDTKRLLEPIGTVSALQVPHRIADAIFRESLLEGKPFRESSIGSRIGQVSARDATALFELCPTALILGMWDSTGPKGGLGAKFERALVAEIVGIDAEYGVKTSSRIDPTIRKNPTLYETSNGDWTPLASEAQVDSKNKPKPFGKKLSELNLGNVTPDMKDKQKQLYHGGVTISSAEQTIVLSLPALRRLRFPVAGEDNSDRDSAARTVLAALALCAAALAAENGLDLRSRCLLWPVKPLAWELLGKPGEKREEVLLSGEDAIQLLNTAVEKAVSLGLKWPHEPVTLTPSDRLLKTVVASQKLASQQGGESGEGGE